MYENYSKEGICKAIFDEKMRIYGCQNQISNAKEVIKHRKNRISAMEAELKRREGIKLCQKSK